MNGWNSSSLEPYSQCSLDIAFKQQQQQQQQNSLFSDCKLFIHSIMTRKQHTIMTHKKFKCMCVHLRCAST